MLPKQLLMVANLPVRNARQEAPIRNPMLQIVRIILVIIGLRLKTCVIVSSRIRRYKNLNQPRQPVAYPEGKQNTHNRQRPSPPCEAIMNPKRNENSSKKN
jgi:hypothetical protein